MSSQNLGRAPEAIAGTLAERGKSSFQVPQDGLSVAWSYEANFSEVQPGQRGIVLIAARVETSTMPAIRLPEWLPFLPLFSVTVCLSKRLSAPS